MTLNNKLLSVFILILASCFTTFAQQPNNDADYDIQDPMMIRIRDGIDISAIVVRKKGVTAKAPAVLFYTTYTEGPGDSFFGKLAADRGFVGVVAYARGIRTDPKLIVPYDNDGRDINGIVDWISKQEWSDGKVGMFGGSHTGFSQWSAAKDPHPALKTIVPQVPAMPGFDTPMENNVFLTGLALNWSNDLFKLGPLPRDLNDKWYEAGGSYRAFDTFAGQANCAFQKWLQHPAYDNYWRAMVPTAAEYARLKIPVLTTTGYYDGCAIGALEYFRQHQKANKSAEHYFVIGPYDHFSGQRNARLELMGYKIDPVANVSMRRLALDWLEYVLKGAKKPEILKDKVNYQVMGANEWRHAPSLAAVSNAELRFYLNKNKVMSPQKSTAKDFITQTADFKDRTGDAQNNYFTPVIINDELNDGNGVVFTTDPLTKSFALNGSFGGRLNLIINKKDLDITATLYEQTADGKYFYLTRYLGRASYAADNSRRKLLRPGKMETVAFANTRMVSKQIAKGSRLVVILNVNKHPYEQINYGSGRDVSDETIADANEPMRIQWYNDSFITIPIWE